MNKIFLPITLVVVSLILGGFYYSAQTAKQESIERQQRIEQENKKIEADKDYSLKQKTACLDIYKTEASKWGNVTGWRYDESSDVCKIEYEQNPKKTKEECQKEYYGVDGKLLPMFLTEYALCTNGLFEKDF